MFFLQILTLSIIFLGEQLALKRMHIPMTDELFVFPVAAVLHFSVRFRGRGNCLDTLSQYCNIQNLQNPAIKYCKLFLGQCIYCILYFGFCLHCYTTSHVSHMQLHICCVMRPCNILYKSRVQ